MPEDLPIYSDTTLRTSLQFADLAKLNVPDRTPALIKADQKIAEMEGAANLERARSVLSEPSSDALIRAHGLLFEGRSGAGVLRTTPLKPLYPGQDCVPPEFIGRSLMNLFSWVEADSFEQIHSIEGATLAMTRVLDIWPFEFGNLTVGVVFANHFLLKNGLTPFFVEASHLKEFQVVVAQALRIETQPLVNVIFRTVRREMEALAVR